jgi:LuxR family quorum-sensing system transcriptional regulator SolR
VALSEAAGNGILHRKSAAHWEVPLKAWQDEQLALLLRVKNPTQVFGHLLALARNVGFNYCAYGIRMPLPVVDPQILLFNNYPSDWRRIYDERNYVAVDPTVQHGAHSIFPVVWSDELFTSSRARPLIVMASELS